MQNILQIVSVKGTRASASNIALIIRPGLDNLGSPFLLPSSLCIMLFFKKQDHYPSTIVLNFQLTFCWQKSISQNLSWIHPKMKSLYNSAYIHSSRGKRDILNKQKLANRSVDGKTCVQPVWVLCIFRVTSLQKKKKVGLLKLSWRTQCSLFTVVEITALKFVRLAGQGGTVLPALETWRQENP